MTGISLLSLQLILLEQVELLHGTREKLMEMVSLQIWSAQHGNQLLTHLREDHLQRLRMNPDHTLSSELDRPKCSRTCPSEHPHLVDKEHLFYFSHKPTVQPIWTASQANLTWQGSPILDHPKPHSLKVLDHPELEPALEPPGSTTQWRINRLIGSLKGEPLVISRLANSIGS
ncbi:Uncharacterized protein Fot_31423 [Forsythia ovata]|uniref:Uncharacterized protein n=1 Tax=Forsythia ovata TaxID=205694 RepID=A0ABD1T586_9LAMI